MRPALLFVSMISAFPAVGCSPPALEEYKESRRLMGTEVVITVFHEEGEKARSAMAAAFNEIERLEQILSPYIDSSEIAQLNRDSAVDAGPDTLFVIERALHYHRISRGAFDISVQPMLDLYGRSFRDRGGPPKDREIRAALDLVDSGRILISGNRISMAKAMRITPGGIGKGYAVDCAAAILRDHGVAHGLVNAGGDMVAIGRKRDRPWSIALKDPRQRGYVTVLSLEDQAVATSGDYERFFEPTRKYHHIVDPRTGYSASALASATIVAGSALEADALATAVLILGPEEGMNLVNSLAGIQALLVLPDGQIRTSTGLDFTGEKAP